MPREPAGRFARLRGLRWQPVMLVAALGITGLTIYLAVDRYHVPEEQKELFRYVKTTFPQLHQVTRSIQSGIAGLVDESAPSAEEAARRIDEEIVPSTDYLLEMARAMGFEGVETRALHLVYIEAVEGMRGDVLAMRAAFVDPALPLGEKRKRAHAQLAVIAGRFDAFATKAAEVCRANGIDVKMGE